MVLAPSQQFTPPTSRYLVHPGQRVGVILLFSLATIASIHFSTQLAILLGIGTWTEGAIAHLDFRGGLLVGGVIGLAQWTTLRFTRLPKTWIVATALSWAIAASIQPHLSDSEIYLLAGSTGFQPFTFLVLSLGQWLALRRSLKLGWQWFLLPIGQIVWVLIWLGIVQVAMFGVFILSLGHLMQQPFPFVISGLHLIGIAAYHLIIVAHSTLPVLALCWRSPLSMPQRSGFA